VSISINPKAPGLLPCVFCMVYGELVIRTAVRTNLDLIESAISASFQDYTDHVNPQWVRLLELLRMNTQYTHCSGVELTTAEGRVILDFLSGYCVHNVGHNHLCLPEISFAILRVPTRDECLKYEVNPSSTGG
jgi:4-aminobutyrate aminotransferase-like enzyme